MDISIVITNFNYANYLKECICSCLNQKISSLQFEIIVVDDGSTDNTPAVLAGFSDSRIRKFFIDNVGIEKASNFGFEKATGKFIVRVDADDKLLPNYLITLEPFVKAGFDFIYSDYLVLDSLGNILEQVMLPEFSKSEVLKRGDFLATGTLISSTWIKKIGGYSTKVKNSGLESYELILNMLKLGVEGKHVAQPLFCYRRHNANISKLKVEQIIVNGRRLFAQMQLGEYSTNDNHPYKLKVNK